jgi:hypothetical protein
MKGRDVAAQDGMLMEKGAKQVLREGVENKYDRIKMKRKAENNMKDDKE